MGEIADLINAWVDAEPERTESSLARRAGLHRNDIYNLQKPRRLPADDDKLRAIAPVLGFTFEQLQEKAFRDVGVNLSGPEPVAPEVEVLVAALDGASDEARRTAIAAALAAIDALDR